MRAKAERNILVGLLVLSIVTRSFANPNKSAQEQAKSLLTRAAGVSDLQAPGSSPFRLAARVRLSIRRALDMEGTYTLDWATPDRFRQVISFPGFNDIEVASDGKLWHERNLAYLPLRVWQFQELLNLKKRIRADLQRGDAKNIRTSDHKGARSLCIEFPRDPRPYKTCIDAATGVPLSIEEVSGVVTTHCEYSNYEALGAKMFPHDMRLFENSKLQVEVHVEELALVSVPDPTLFSPIQGANIETWCPDPQPPLMLRDIAVHPNTSRWPDYDPTVTRGRVMLYVVIGTDGRLKNMHIVESLSPLLDANVIKGAEEVRYRPSTCNGVPIEQETVLAVEYFLQQ